MKPIPDTFAELVRDGRHTVASLARHFGVKESTCNRWLTAAGLDRPRTKFVDLPGEEWRTIAGWEGSYEVSNMGRVRGLDRVSCGVRVKGRLIKPYADRQHEAAYRIVNLRGHGRSTNPLVHKLVLEAFVGPRPEGMEACHDNGIKHDNRATNLRWDTHRANMEDQFRHGTKNRRKPREIKWRPGSRGRRPKNWQAIST